MSDEGVKRSLRIAQKATPRFTTEKTEPRKTKTAKEPKAKKTKKEGGKASTQAVSTPTRPEEEARCIPAAEKKSKLSRLSTGSSTAKRNADNRDVSSTSDCQPARKKHHQARAQVRLSGLAPLPQDLEAAVLCWLDRRAVVRYGRCSRRCKQAASNPALPVWQSLDLSLDISLKRFPRKRLFALKKILRLPRFANLQQLQVDIKRRSDPFKQLSPQVWLEVEDTMTDLMQAMPSSLVDLSLSFPRGLMEDEKASYSWRLQETLSNLSKLRSLCITNCYLTLQSNHLNHRHLKKLILTRCGATDSTLFAISKQCTALETLCLTLFNPDGYTAKGLQQVLQGCAALRSLEMAGDQFQKELLDVVIGMPCPSLRRLALQNLGVTDAGLVGLAQQCPSLHELHLYDCREVTPQGVTAAAKLLPELRVICLDITWTSSELRALAPLLPSLELAHFELWDGGARMWDDRDLERREDQVSEAFRAACPSTLIKTLKLSYYPCNPGYCRRGYNLGWEPHLSDGGCFLQRCSSSLEPRKKKPVSTNANARTYLLRTDV
eukprot:g32962.t1